MTFCDILGNFYAIEPLINVFSIPTGDVILRFFMCIKIWYIIKIGDKQWSIRFKYNGVDVKYIDK